MVFINRIIFRISRFKSFFISCVRFLKILISPSRPHGRLGASINLFDGEELLLDLILSVRAEVDFLSVVFQEKGHWGESSADPALPSFLNELKSIGLLDEVFFWSIESIPLGVDEFNSLDMIKREKGLELAREAGCTHFLNLDNDELYTTSGLKYMKKVMMNSRGLKADYSVLRHVQYYKDSSLILKNKEQEYVMGIFPIKRDTNFVYGAKSPFPIDPGRKISGSKIIEFWRFEVCMHHLSYVRRDIRTKLLSAHAREGNLPVLAEIVDRYENYAFPQTGLWGHGMEVELKKIRPKISIKYFVDDSFTRFASGEGISEIIKH